MTKDQPPNQPPAPSQSERQVRLDDAEKAIVKALIFRAMRDGESLQDCLREVFDGSDSDARKKLISNGGIFDAARAAARRKARSG